MTLPRPGQAPKRIPLWAWHLNAWLDSGKQGPRPKRAPKRVPAWFWLWRLYRLARVKKAGSKAWKTYLEAIKASPNPEATGASHRAAIVKWALWGVSHNGSVHYTEDTRRDDFLHEPIGHLPMWTDCSGSVTCWHWAAGGAQHLIPDPSGLNYRYVGWTGSVLANAYKHGKVTTNLAAARPGDPIVIGPGNGWHMTICVKAGADPIVVSHGSEPGPLSEHQSYDRRAPKRVCQLIP